MRRILVEQARRKRGPEAGGRHHRVELSQVVEPEIQEPQLDLLALNEALDKLQLKDRRKSELVKLRFFVGLSNQQAAKLLGVSERTAYGDWVYAKCWLRAELSETQSGDRS
jgi:RNA polymerase sigma factor (TIGR02999 family)